MTMQKRDFLKRTYGLSTRAANAIIGEFGEDVDLKKLAREPGVEIKILHIPGVGKQTLSEIRELFKRWKPSKVKVRSLDMIMARLGRLEEAAASLSHLDQFEEKLRAWQQSATTTRDVVREIEAIYLRISSLLASEDIAKANSISQQLAQSYVKLRRAEAGFVDNELANGPPSGLSLLRQLDDFRRQVEKLQEASESNPS